jgi:hypothetical protein
MNEVVFEVSEIEFNKNKFKEDWSYAIKGNQ